MDLWIELEGISSKKNEILLKNLERLSEDNIETDLLLLSDDFLHLLTVSFTTINNLSDISFKFFLKIFNLIFKKNKQKNGFWDTKMMMLNMLMMVIEKNLNFLKFDDENFKIFFSLINGLKSKFWDNCCFGYVFDSLNKFLVDRLKNGDGNFQREIEIFLMKVSLRIDDVEGGYVSDAVFEIFLNEMKNEQIKDENFDEIFTFYTSKNSIRRSKVIEILTNSSDLLILEKISKILKVKKINKN